MNPLLDALTLPRYDEITADHIAPAIDEAIAAHQATVAQIVRTRPTRFADVWLPLERADNAISAIWSTVSHLHGTVDTPKLRTAYAAGQRRIIENSLAVSQNRDLYDVLLALSVSPEFATLPLADRVVVEHAIRDFTLSGVALDEVARARFADISVELSGLSTEFAAAVLDATDAWFEHVTDEAVLAGLSAGDKAMLANAARSRGLTGWVVTLQQPSVNAILHFAEDRGLRERVYHANTTRASDQGPHAGQFDNSARIARTLALRHEAAALLGFPDPVAWSFETKMAQNTDEVLVFLRKLAERARPTALRELDEATQFAAETIGLTELAAWDVAFVAEGLRQARYALDEQEVRAYFPIERVVKGWQALLARLFGIRLTPRDDVALYHPNAQYYDVMDEQGMVVAGVYLDLHARRGKRGGAWMSQARPRLRDGNVSTVPVANLICNFAPHSGDMPSLLTHKDLLTLLHETGHCLHHVLTRVDRPNIAGISGFEWDAIELPSQLMEDFAWDRDVLISMSGHHQTGEPLPVALFDRMTKARRFQTGMFIVRQVELSLFDLLLHTGTLGDDPVEVIEAVRDEVAVIHPPSWQRFPHAFNHIFAGPYASGYYSYLWAEVLAADGFRQFAEAGLFDRATGDKLRDEVLARGATRPAGDSFRAFRGRNPDPNAMLERHGLMDAHQ